MDKQGPIVEHRKLYLISCHNHNGKEYEKEYVCVCVCVCVCVYTHICIHYINNWISLLYNRN